MERKQIEVKVGVGGEGLGGGEGGVFKTKERWLVVDGVDFRGRGWWVGFRVVVGGSVLVTVRREGRSTYWSI